jgi:hypothetical protein
LKRLLALPDNVHHLGRHLQGNKGAKGVHHISWEA